MKIQLLTSIKRLISILRNRKKRDFNRVIPLNELVTDRWEKAEFCGFGIGSSVYDSAYVFGNVKVGENTWIGPNVILDGSGNLNIGSNCSIAANVQIYTHDSVKWAVSNGIEPYEYSETVISDCCYIGPNSVISKGVTLGKGCIVGANSFVNKSFPANSKIAGNPARLL